MTGLRSAKAGMVRLFFYVKLPPSPISGRCWGMRVSSELGQLSVFTLPAEPGHDRMNRSVESRKWVRALRGTMETGRKEKEGSGEGRLPFLVPVNPKAFPVGVPMRESLPSFG